MRDFMAARIQNAISRDEYGNSVNAAEPEEAATPLTYRQAVARIAFGFSGFILAMAAVWMIVSLGRSN